LSYAPWDTLNSTHVTMLGNQSNLVQYSQRPKIFINPTENEGGEMELPFFHYENWINVQSLINFSEMGSLRINSFAPLRHAGGGSDNITITLFAWAEDVALCVPTTSLAAQAGKGKIKKKVKVGASETEYGDGIISKPATAIAEIAGALEHIPGIAPFAMATKIGANAVAGIARLFGFSRPVVLAAPQFYKPQFCSSLATCDSDETTVKLTVDSKQEITVDPRTVGLAGVDELALKYITQKESYFTQFSWAPDQAANTLLFSTRVAPMLEHVSSTANLYFPTALSFATFPFKNWSGTLKFRFQIVASGFHHGRLQFSYEPTEASNTTSGEFNTVYNEIVDINESNDFEMEVAWAAHQPYKDTTWPRSAQHYGDSTLVNLLPDEIHANGIITVRVLSELVAPNDAADITINCFISAGDDFELKNPDDTVIKIASYHEPVVAQSGAGSLCANDDPLSAETKAFVGNSDISAKNMKSSIFFGQNIASFRTLLRRYNKYRSWVYRRDNGGSGAFSQSTLNTPYKPRMRGFNPAGLDTDVLANAYDYVSPSLFSYLLPAYVGYRGSMRVKMRSKSEAPWWYDVSKTNDSTLPLESFSVATIFGPTMSDSQISQLGAEYDNAGITGTSLTPTTITPVVEIERPFFTGKRFAFAQNVGQNTSKDGSNGLIQQTKIVTHTNSSYDKDVSDEYRSVGEDFNVFFFLNAPPRWEYPDPSPSI